MKSGFTLIELLVVILIISILMALLMPTIVHMFCAGRESTALTTIKDLELALKAYNLDTNTYPAGDGVGSKTMIDALTKNMRKTGTPYYPDTVELDASGSLVSPVDITKPYNYKYPGTHNKMRFDIWTINCDGVEDGLNNWSK